LIWLAVGAVAIDPSAVFTHQSLGALSDAARYCRYLGVRRSGQRVKYQLIAVALLYVYPVDEQGMRMNVQSQSAIESLHDGHSSGVRLVDRA